jgi:hypothetical protein
MKGKQLLWGVGMATLLAMSAAMANEHAQGADGATKDERKTIELDPSARALVLTEMRQFLTGIQGMTEALSKDDLKTVARTAHSLGMQAAHEVPPEVKAKLPMEFKQLGFAVHREFDQLAMDAESLGDPRHTLKQMGGILQQCVACHSVYQIKQIEAAGPVARK